MRHTLSRTALAAAIRSTFADPSALSAALDTPPALPDDLESWLARLMLLSGVPFTYLVPDERMLPPESIRFFYVDMNWVDALVDGALSPARNPSATFGTAAMNLDRVLVPIARAQAAGATGAVRADKLGAAAPPVSLQVVSGFLLRSALVAQYPGIGVNAYPKGGTPDDPVATLLTLLRWETLGPQSDTLLCLVDGDAYRVDVHEPAEHLHYGIDAYADDDGAIAAAKAFHTFTRDPETGAVTIAEDGTSTDLSGYFRSDAPRTLRVGDVAALIAAQSGAGGLDSAELGFELTEGVGVVKFVEEGA